MNKILQKRKMRRIDWKKEIWLQARKAIQESPDKAIQKMQKENKKTSSKQKR